MDFVTNTYRLTKQFPKEELYGITQQIRRSAVSIPSNIAEGSGRNTAKDMDHFLSISLGSSFEIETQLLVAKNLGYFSEPNFESLNAELMQIQKMQFSLKNTLKS